MERGEVEEEMQGVKADEHKRRCTRCENLPHTPYLNHVLQRACRALKAMLSYTYLRTYVMSLYVCACVRECVH